MFEVEGRNLSCGFVRLVCVANTCVEGKAALGKPVALVVIQQTLCGESLHTGSDRLVVTGTCWREAGHGLCNVRQETCWGIARWGLYRVSGVGVLRAVAHGGQGAGIDCTPHRYAFGVEGGE